MVKFPYVVNYNLELVEIPEAEKLLAEYNDFYVFNQAQYLNNKKDETDDDKEIDGDETAKNENSKVLEKIAHDDEKDFSALWGSRDFASATLMGMSIEWDKIQEILMEEQERGTHPKDSSMNATAKQLRCVASLLTFMNKILNAFNEKHANPEMVGLIRSGFEILLEELSTRELEIPEYEKEKTKFLKIKTIDGLIDYAKILFALGK
jgi:hypothetical protein